MKASRMTGIQFFQIEEVNEFRQKMANSELNIEFVIWAERSILDQTNEFSTRV